MGMPVPAAIRTMTVFEVFARERRPLTNAELAKFLNVPESSCSDLVNTLLAGGYLMKTPPSRRVYPTSRLHAIANAISSNDAVQASIVKACELLRDRTGETSLCGRLEDGAVRLVATCDGIHPLRYAADSGDKLSLHVSALGKAILALSDADKAARQLLLKPRKPLASGTLTDIEPLLAQVAQFKAQGYALVENEGGEDLSALAVAGIVGTEPVGLSIAGPVSRLRYHRTEYVESLREVGNQLFTGSYGGLHKPFQVL
ncbi:IclR family transcriptional regulator [Comamonas sp. C11]|uniref:IclR family transcriptional regulator n=1 Tax=Comamonas sp. C11 TaxID=2966554 RepID=UPI002111DA25|nr:IclR family transcriptional regulator [Comamonas sp. C11]UUC96737.1 IclR family transcriptional regulator [Comamonas sp. C11]